MMPRMRDDFLLPAKELLAKRVGHRWASERDDKFSKIESAMPDLVAEMRKDLIEHPLCREFVVLKKIWMFWYPDRKILTYYYEDHPDLDSKCRILEDLRLIRDI